MHALKAKLQKGDTLLSIPGKDGECQNWASMDPRLHKWLFVFQESFLAATHGTLVNHPAAAPSHGTQHVATAIWGKGGNPENGTKISTR